MTARILDFRSPGATRAAQAAATASVARVHQRAAEAVEALSDPVERETLRAKLARLLACAFQDPAGRGASATGRGCVGEGGRFALPASLPHRGESLASAFAGIRKLVAATLHFWISRIDRECEGLESSLPTVSAARPRRPPERSRPTCARCAPETVRPGGWSRPGRGTGET